MIEKSKAVEERRFKIMVIGEDRLFTVLLCMLKQYPEYVSLPNFSNVPEDVELVRCFYIPEKIAFGFLIAHETFNPSPMGCMIEHIEADLKENIINICERMKEAP
jgi:hypothetical protein